jgi:uncharacterized membrane protein YccC
MVALLYGLLGLLKPELLILRLEETAVGSAIGVAVMMSLLPVRSREALRGALGALAAALRELLARAADLLDDRGDAAALVGAAWQVAEKTQALHDAVGPLKRGWTILIARDAHGGPHRPALCLSCARSRPRRYGGRHSA